MESATSRGVVVAIVSFLVVAGAGLRSDVLFGPFRNSHVSFALGPGKRLVASRDCESSGRRTGAVQLFPRRAPSTGRPHSSGRATLTAAMSICRGTPCQKIHGDIGHVDRAVRSVTW